MNAANDPGGKSNAGPQPPRDTELRELFHDLTGFERIALAVSGGADSLALMVMIRRWLDRLAPPLPTITVLTVDHRLRQEAASEAEWVAARANELDFAHETLVWDAEKPATGIQAAARAARYRLMSRYCRQHEIPVIVTAHTQNDQAETVVMRLGRGSGVDGLSGMPPNSECGGVQLLRPLLPLARSDLEALLRSQGRQWLDDPSNQSELYERVRIRKALHTLETLGVSRASLALTARRLRRARAALDIAVAEFLDNRLTVHDAAYAQLPVSAFLDTPEELALRALARITVAFGGSESAPQLARLEDAYTRLGQRPARLTIGGCLFSLRRDDFVITREFGRLDRSETPLQPGETADWDRRFAIRAPSACGKTLIIRPLGPDGLAAIRQSGGGLGAMPRAAALTLPSLWSGGQPVYAPFAEFTETLPGQWLIGAEASFLNKARLFAKPRKTGADATKQAFSSRC
jgi:tRNA(Ile)-lysidine synthase